MINSPPNPRHIKQLRIKYLVEGSKIVVKPQWNDGKSWNDFVFFNKPVHPSVVMTKFRGNYLSVSMKEERMEKSVERWLKRWVVKNLPRRDMEIQVEKLLDKRPKPRKARKIGEEIEETENLEEQEAVGRNPEADEPERDNRSDTSLGGWQVPTEAHPE